MASNHADGHGHGSAGHRHSHGAHGHGKHGHGHGHAHAQAHAGSLGGWRSLALALGLTLAFALVEFTAGWWFGSLALMSDAGHMVSDAASLGLAWFAAWVARRPAGMRHSFGLARAEVIAAFVNGLAMLAVVLIIAVEAVSRLLDPQPVQGGGVMVVAAVGLVINIVVAWILSRGEKSLNQRAALLHVLGDLAGSVAALLAGAVIFATGWQPIDPILSLVIGALILLSTFQLVREALHVLMEGVPRSLELEEVGVALARIAHVREVHDLHIWHISSGQVALSAHVRLDELAQWPRILAEARRVLAARFGIEHVTLQPEVMHAAGPDQAVIRVFKRR
jgi:cobalt-zinc-cadmium efflux system protein